MKNSIGKDTIKLSAAKIIAQVIGLINTMLLSRYRTLEEYGTYSQTMLVINLAITIFLFGLPSCMNYFLAAANSDKERKRIASVYYTLNISLGIIVGIILTITIRIYAEYFNNDSIYNLWFVFLLYPIIMIIFSSMDNILIVEQRTNSLMRIKILCSFFTFSALIFAKLIKCSFENYMLIYILGQTLVLIYFFVLIFRIYGPLKILLDLPLIKQMIEVALPLGLANVLGTLKAQMDQLVIGRFFSTSEAAVYANAAKELPVTVISASLTAVLLPQIVRLLKKEQKQEAIILWGDATLLSYSFVCFLVAGIFVFAPEAITFLYSSKYLSGCYVFRVYLLVLLFRCTYFGMILNSMGETKFILWSSIASLGVNLILNFVLYYLIGFSGPAIATLIATAATALLQLLASAKVLKVKLSRIFPWEGLLKISIINCGIAIVMNFIKKVIPLDVYIGNIPEAFILAFLWGCIYLVLIRKFLKEKWTGLKIDT